jgi:hypothetical protein
MTAAWLLAARSRRETDLADRTGVKPAATVGTFLHPCAAGADTTRHSKWHVGHPCHFICKRHG